jgi:hypothetical protein
MGQFARQPETLANSPSRRLAADFLAVRRHVLRSIGSDPPFVAFRLSVLWRAETMARMLREAPQFYARIGGVLYLLIIAAGL